MATFQRGSRTYSPDLHERGNETVYAVMGGGTERDLPDATADTPEDSLGDERKNTEQGVHKSARGIVFPHFCRAALRKMEPSKQ